MLLARRLAAEDVGEGHLEIGVAERREQLPRLDVDPVGDAIGDRLDHAVDPGEDVAAMDRLERSLPLEPQFGGNEDEGCQGRQRRHGCGQSPGEIAGSGQHARLAEEIEQAEERQARVIQGVCQRHPPVVGDEVDAGPLPAVERRGGEPFGHQHADRLDIGIGV